jgi:drug/metabolite transporter (DMT)-like permease
MQNPDISTFRQRVLGHMAILFSVLVWATTYISTKKLLSGFSPMQILLVRTVLGFVFLFACNPRKLVYHHKKDRILFVIAGLCGLFLYYFLENTALIYSSVSNVGVIVAVAPFSTFLASYLIIREEKLFFRYFLGFGLALSGIGLMSYSGKTELHLNPLGDFLAFLGILVWAVYAVLSRIIAKKGYPTLLATRTMFFYALVGMLLCQVLFPKPWDVAKILLPQYRYHFLFLGLLASATCFVTWNYGIKTIGSIKSSFYLYLSPVLTIVFSIIFLDETITLLASIGAGLTLGGLLVSQYRPRKTKKEWEEKSKS